MTRVIHTGDTHLGYQQYHLPARRRDFLDAFRRVAEDGIEAEVDAVVHAGDLFHDRRPGLEDLLGTLSVLHELDEAGIPFLAVVGNHESKRDGQWLDLFASMGVATRLGERPVVVGDTAFYGMDFVPPSRRDGLDYQFEPHDADHAALVAHGLFQPLVPDYGGVEWDAAEVLERANVAFDAMLLADEHSAERVEIDGTWVTYCGSTERAAADEREERGYNVVEFADGEARLSRRGLPTREFVYVEIELGEGEGIDRVREQVSQYDLADAVTIVDVDGGGEEVRPARVEEFVHEQGALVARVTDRRETADEPEIEVSFADPDDAVRERVREMGLSSAARDLDETIRASKVPDTNVADTVEEHVHDLVADGDPSDFESAPADAGDGGPDRNAGRREDESEPEAVPTVAAAGDAEADTPAEERSPAAAHQPQSTPATAAESATAGDGTSDGAAGGASEEVADGASGGESNGASDPPSESGARTEAKAPSESTSGADTGTASETDGSEEEPATDDQSSMEDFL